MFFFLSRWMVSALSLILLVNLSFATCWAQTIQRKPLQGLPVAALQPEQLPSVASSQGTQIAARPALPLSQVLDRVSRFHPKLAGAVVQQNIAAAKRLQKAGAFDPVLSADNVYQRYNSSSKPGDAKSYEMNEVALELPTRLGAKIIAGGRYADGTVKSPASATGETGEYFLGLKLPLLRGFRMNPKVAAERQAELDQLVATAELQLTRLSVLQDAGFAYWDWAASVQKYEVARSLLEIARFRFEAVQIRARAGDLPEIDAVEAEQEVMRREESLTKALRGVQKTALKLGLYLWSDTSRPDDTFRTPLEADLAATGLPGPDFQPQDFREPILLEQKLIDGQRQTALNQRPEFSLLGVQRQKTDVDYRLARNDRLPAIDLSLWPGYDTGDKGVGATLKAGVSVEVNLRQRDARGRMLAAQLYQEKIGLDRGLTELRVLTEVNDAVSAIQTIARRYQAAEREYRLAVRMETGERDRFNLGDSTLFLVNQRERATAEVRNKLIDIQAEYEQAWIALLAASGQL
jgi:outer membrane protein TolC